LDQIQHLVHVGDSGMAVARMKDMHMILDQSAIQVAFEGVQDEMMVAMLNIMQGAATTCANICIDRLNALQTQMLRAFEEEARRLQSPETTALRGDCWEGLGTSTPASLTPERRQIMNEEHRQSSGENKTPGRASEQDPVCKGVASDLEAPAAVFESSEVGMNPAPIAKTTTSSPSVVSSTSAGRSSPVLEARKANAGAFEPPGRIEKRSSYEKAKRLARAAVQKKASMTQPASSLTRSAFNGIGTMKRAASSAANSAVSAANTAASTVQGRSPNATEKTAGIREHISSVDEALGLQQASSLQPQQDEWWGTDQPAGQPGGIGTSSETPLFDHPSSQQIAGHQSQQDTGVDMRPKQPVQSFSLSDSSSSEEEEAC